MLHLNTHSNVWGYFGTKLSTLPPRGQNVSHFLELAERHLCQPYCQSSFEQHIRSWSSQRPLILLHIAAVDTLWDHVRSGGNPVLESLTDWAESIVASAPGVLPPVLKVWSRTILILIVFSKGLLAASLASSEAGVIAYVQRQEEGDFFIHG